MKNLIPSHIFTKCTLLNKLPKNKKAPIVNLGTATGPQYANYLNKSTLLRWFFVQKKKTEKENQQKR